MVADVQLKCAGSSTDRDLAAKVALRQDPHQWHLVFSHFFLQMPTLWVSMVVYVRWFIVCSSSEVFWYFDSAGETLTAKYFPWLCIFQCPDILIWVYSSFFHESSFAISDQLHDDTTMDLGCCHLDLWSAFSQHLHLSPLWTTSICLQIQSELISVLSDGMKTGRDQVMC